MADDPSSRGTEGGPRRSRRSAAEPPPESWMLLLARCEQKLDKLADRVEQRFDLAHSSLQSIHGDQNRQDSQIAELRKDVGKLCHVVLDGNGRPSLNAQMAVSQRQIEELNERVGELARKADRSSDRWWQIATTISGWVVAVLAFLVLAYLENTGK